MSQQGVPSTQFCRLVAVLGLVSLGAGCSEPVGVDILMESAGRLENPAIVEASGLQASPGGQFFYVINDSGNPAVLFAIDASGADLGAWQFEGARNRDWEELAWWPTPNGGRLVIADMGDNAGKRDAIRFYIAQEPVPELSPGPRPEALAIQHTLEAEFPDGPRDAESLAWDEHGQQLLLISKRDRPQRIYGIPAASLLSDEKVTLNWLGILPPLPPPSQRELASDAKRAAWATQPNGMDISPDGRQAALVTYRGIYVYSRKPDQDWVEAFQNPPFLVRFPRLMDAESISFSADGNSLWVTNEGRHPPLFRFEYLMPKTGQSRETP